MTQYLTIRNYTEADLPALRKIILEAENFGEPFLESELLNLKKDSIPDFGIVFVAIIKNKVVGYITLRINIFALSIDSIIVKGEHQRRGIGRALIERAKEYAKSKGLKVLRTDTGIFMDYAIRFYMSCGFEPCGYVDHDFGLHTKQLHFYKDLTK